MQDLEAQILWRVKGDIDDRKHLEAWLISRLNTVTPFGLNIKSSPIRIDSSFGLSLHPRAFLFALLVGGCGLVTGMARLFWAHLTAFARQVC